MTISSTIVIIYIENMIDQLRQYDYPIYNSIAVQKCIASLVNHYPLLNANMYNTVLNTNPGDVVFIPPRSRIQFNFMFYVGFMHKTTTNMNLPLSSWKFSVPALYQGHFWIRKFFIQKNLENSQASLKQAQNNHFWYLIQVLFLSNIGNDIQSGVWGLREEVFLVYCPFFYSLKRLQAPLGQMALRVA
jgi:hypothetical protein